MVKTKQWAASLGIDVEDALPAIADYNEPTPRTSQEIAIRTLILHAIAATGYGVDPGPIIEWLIDQSIWQYASPAEQALMKSTTPTDEILSEACWRQEAQWALLWAINKVDSLGLPTQTCDTGSLVDDIMPGLGDSIEQFVSSARLRQPGEILAENDRTYNLHCYARPAIRQGTLPDDLVYPVLFQRYYAFEWLTGTDLWDGVQTDT
ncbi:DUF4272 domain-containing protein [Gimesia sp.]|uniref:DUF4272 domain-containing protein n=1 Tax=Gimesia sp. TaxID=2024833 RepID=UPI003A95649F